MKSAVRGLVVLMFAAGLQVHAQSPQTPAGVTTEWDIAVVLKEIGAYAGRLNTALDKVHADQWVAKGASETYAVQLRSSQDQARAIEQTCKALAGDPEKLAVSFELFLRIIGLENMLANLEDGLRRYQSPADAEALASLAAENGPNRDRFVQYVSTLAADKERQLELMDREAQRCRGMLFSQPPTGQGKKE